jgi:hypothetical protein
MSFQILKNCFLIGLIGMSFSSVSFAEPTSLMSIDSDNRIKDIFGLLDSTSLTSLLTTSKQCQSDAMLIIQQKDIDSFKLATVDQSGSLTELEKMRDHDPKRFMMLFNTIAESSPNLLQSKFSKNNDTLLRLVYDSRNPETRLKAAEILVHAAPGLLSELAFGAAEWGDLNTLTFLDEVAPNSLREVKMDEDGKISYTLAHLAVQYGVEFSSEPEKMLAFLASKAPDSFLLKSHEGKFAYDAGCMNAYLKAIVMNGASNEAKVRYHTREEFSSGEDEYEF